MPHSDEMDRPGRLSRMAVPKAPITFQSSGFSTAMRYHSLADIAEMKACGYDPDTLERARENHQRGLVAREICPEIRAALKGVTLGLISVPYNLFGLVLGHLVTMQGYRMTLVPPVPSDTLPTLARCKSQLPNKTRAAETKKPHPDGPDAAC